MAFTRSPVRSRSGPPNFIFGSDFPQVAEGRCSCAGSNKAISVERDSLRKEQLLEPLALIERRLHPQIGRARQNPFCERQDALYVEFFELVGVTTTDGPFR